VPVDASKNKQKRVYQPSYKDSTVVASGRAYTPEQVLSFILQAESGYLAPIYSFMDEMRARDAHLDGELAKAEDYLTGARIDVLPYPPRPSKGKGGARDMKKATDVAAAVEEIMFSPSVRLDVMIGALSDGLWKGIGGFEYVTAAGGKLNREMIVDVIPIPSQRFRYKDNTTELMLQTTGDEKDLVPIEKVSGNIVYLVAEPEVPTPARRGIMRRCMSLWLIRAYGPQWWSRFVELFGSPMRVGKYMSGDTVMQQAIVNALQRLGSSGWAALPDGANIEFIESTARSTGNPPHEVLLDWAAREMSKVILGSTQGTDVGRNTGSKASAQVHHDVTIARSMSRATCIASAIRQQLIYQIVARNFGEDIAMLYTPEFRLRVESKPDIYNASQAIRMLMDAGMKTIPVSWVHDMLSIPVPDPAEPVLELPLMPGMPPKVGDELPSQPGIPRANPPKNGKKLDVPEPKDDDVGSDDGSDMNDE